MHRCAGAAFLLFDADAASMQKPNIVWLHVESTDGRTWQKDMHDVVPIPNIQSLQERGTNFVNTYADVPICCPSRASVWTGRRPHNIPHVHNDMQVGGAWNNYEGIGLEGSEFDHQKIGDRLAKENYTVNIMGKEDWLSHGHSYETMIDSFSIYARWPYNIPEEGGFHIWGDCDYDVTVNTGNESAHKGDWKTLNNGVKWIRDGSGKGAAAQQPFFFYQGMGIVHPPYATDEGHLARIPIEKVTAPHWPAFDDPKIHPCDLQTSMKKGCLRPDRDLNNSHHKINVRAVYYAMIAEFDDMVGAYMQAVEDAGLTDRTVFVVSSDHGDMQMEHMQFYKMVAYEASSRVPMVMAGPGIGQHEVQTLTSLIDILPTFLELAGAETPPRSSGRFDANAEAIDGYSLVPLLQHGDDKSKSHPDHVISQFHGETLAMSWYMIRQGEMKYVVWGTGSEHEAQLFNLTADPDEWLNLANVNSYGSHASERERFAQHMSLAQDMDALLRKSIDYPSVTKEVAKYNLDMAKWWVSSELHWKGVLNGTQGASVAQPIGNKNYPVNESLSHGKVNDWGPLWQEHNDWYFDAWYRWIDGDGDAIPRCPSTLVHNWGSPEPLHVV